ncbi:LexA family protein [Liquorilactobacillus mali]|uniref:Xre family DNA-binding protein n=1 Tax=Liquorilactobacillus mali TaxID=1618 RepID=A0A0R2FRM2_9LACO|nr:LexA family transcriptional regulator [Liquorilactobacillus mali]KRN31139.1 Xre family DNA-binding protein [Liquorilactobacillus mali]
MNNNDEIISYLTKLKDEKNLSISEIARRVGMAKSAVSRYFNKTREFPLNKTEEFANALGTTPEKIIGIRKPSNIIPITKTVKIPLLGEIACGDPILAEENIEEYIDEPVNYLPSGTCFYLRAKGNSMKPTIPNGAKVLIRQQPDVEDNEIAAVLMTDSNEATLKRIKRADGTIFLMPDNPEYSPILVNKDNPARILGKVIRMVIDF